MVNATVASRVPCPSCKTPTPYRLDNPYRPFCSERCQQLDFGAWATERFRVEASASSADEESVPAGLSVKKH